VPDAAACCTALSSLDASLGMRQLSLDLSGLPFEPGVARQIRSKAMLDLDDFARP